MMEQYGLWLLLAAGELVFILALVLLAIWLRQREAVRRDRKAIRALVERARKGKIQRREQIRRFLTGQFGLSGDELTELGCAIHKAEMRLIQTFASAYLNRNAAKAANFAVEVEAGVEPYWRLSAEAANAEAGAGEAAETTQETDEAAAHAGATDEPVSDDGEVARLRGENNRLSEELRVTMDTMSRMLNEYSTIFSKDTDLSDITVVDGEADMPPDEEPAGEVATEAAEQASAAAEPSADDGSEQDAEQPAIHATAEQDDAASPNSAEQPIGESGEAGGGDAVPSVSEQPAPGETVSQTVADRAPPLDPAMRDLSGADDEPTDMSREDMPGAEQQEQRQRRIDADS
jgi:hypothetical protein